MLIVTRMDPADPPHQIHQNCVTKLHQLKSYQGEADVIIIHQLIYASKQTSEPITIVCDDTDVFLLLIHFCKI